MRSATSDEDTVRHEAVGCGALGCGAAPWSWRLRVLPGGQAKSSSSELGGGAVGPYSLSCRWLQSLRTARDDGHRRTSDRKGIGGSRETWQGSRRRTLMAVCRVDRRSRASALVWFDGHLCVDHFHGSMPVVGATHGPGTDRPYESSGAYAADRIERGRPSRDAADRAKSSAVTPEPTPGRSA